MISTPQSTTAPQTKLAGYTSLEDVKRNNMQDIVYMAYKLTGNKYILSDALSD